LSLLSNQVNDVTKKNLWTRLLKANSVKTPERVLGRHILRILNLSMIKENTFFLENQ
jgi:hypothetical protein